MSRPDEDARLARYLLRECAYTIPQIAAVLHVSERLAVTLALMPLSSVFVGFALRCFIQGPIE